MLTAKQVRKLIGGNSLSDEEILKIRDDFRFLAEAVFDVWQAENNSKSNGDNILTARNAELQKT